MSFSNKRKKGFQFRPISDSGFILKSKMAKVQMSTEMQFSVPINNLTEFNSPEFETSSVSWKVVIIREIKNSNGKCEENDVIHVCLSCDYEASRQTWTGWWIDATAAVTLISNKDHSLSKIISLTRFGKNHSMVEMRDFISWKELINESNGFVGNGKFLIQVNLSSTLVQKRLSICEEKNKTSEIEPEFSAVQNEKFQGKKGRNNKINRSFKRYLSDTKVPHDS